jgi:hypothetical protein
MKMMNSTFQCKIAFYSSLSKLYVPKGRCSIAGLLKGGMGRRSIRHNLLIHGFSLHFPMWIE